MAINTKGKWWKGENVDDLVEYLRLYSEEGYPAEKTLPSVCTACGHRFFKIHVDQDEGCAKRFCANCGNEAFIADSEEYWEDAEPTAVKCPCKNNTFELAVAFAFRENGDIKWIYLGTRCEKCGILGSPVDWKIDYSPTEQLLEMV